ncbi:MAG TPA: hypothetical protein VI451_15750 [Anaerolineales bacterium]|nr:hypothetical protein [Anaerolineales bacterium]
MNGLPLWIIDIENLSRGLEVLLVEGEDDVDIFRHFLDQHSPGWETRMYLAAANGKRRVLQRLKKSTGLPEELENRPVTDEIEIRRILETWHDQLAPEAILDQYHLELARANTLTTTEQLIGYIHGKKFFKQVVVITLNNLFAQISSESWIGRFQNSDMMPPQDMKDLLDRVISNL